MISIERTSGPRAMMGDHRDSREGNAGSTDHQLFILWEHGRRQESRIVDALTDTFVIKRVVEVAWTPENARANLCRFYGKIATSRMAKLGQVGSGPFLAIVVRDPRPRFGYRIPVSGGYRMVNTNVVDAKQLFRAWTGGRNLVHCTGEPAEFVRDMTLLFGPGFPERFGLATEGIWNGETEPYREDLIGANGWKNFEELFSGLNDWAEYVVLRNFEELGDTSGPLDLHDVDILSRNQMPLAAALNGRRHGTLQYQPSFDVVVGERKVRFDLRGVGDNYFDSRWQEHILANRELHRDGFYIPSRSDHFFSLLYHSALQKRQFPLHHVKTLSALSAALDVEQITKHYIGGNENYHWYNDRNIISYISSQFLLGRQYNFTFPKDISVPLRYSIIKRLHRRVRPSFVTYFLARPLRKRWVRVKSLVGELSRRRIEQRSRPLAKPVPEPTVRSSPIVVLEGGISPGRGVAPFHLARASSMFERLLGRPAVPGTFNLVLARPVELSLDRMAFSVDGSHLFWWVELNDRRCLAYRWKGCPLHVIEVVADHHIRKKYKLVDGDRVRLLIEADILQTVALPRRIAWLLVWRYREFLYYTSLSYVRATKWLGFVRRMAFQRMPPQ